MGPFSDMTELWGMYSIQRCVDIIWLENLHPGQINILNPTMDPLEDDFPFQLAAS